MRRANLSPLSIGGMTPFSTIDFPDHLAAVLFCQGCPWRCRYCHNPHLLDHRVEPALSWAEVERFLHSRQNLLEAVVFSGGEPLFQPGLLTAVQRVRQLGFKVGLQTAGINSRHLAKLLPDLDWVGIDIKAPLEDYAQITGISSSGKHPFQSIRLLLEAGIDYEVRTTVHPHLLTESALLKLATALAEFGVQHYAVQMCRTIGCLDDSLPTRLPSRWIVDNTGFLQSLQTLIPDTIVR